MTSDSSEGQLTLREIISNPVYSRYLKETSKDSTLEPENALHSLLKRLQKYFVIGMRNKLLRENTHTHTHTHTHTDGSLRGCSERG
jgi:hypothetical protein